MACFLAKKVADDSRREEEAVRRSTIRRPRTSHNRDVPALIRKASICMGGGERGILHVKEDTSHSHKPVGISTRHALTTHARFLNFEVSTRTDRRGRTTLTPGQGCSDSSSCPCPSTPPTEKHWCPSSRSTTGRRAYCLASWCLTRRRGTSTWGVKTGTRRSGWSTAGRGRRCRRPRCRRPLPRLPHLRLRLLLRLLPPPRYRQQLPWMQLQVSKFLRLLEPLMRCQQQPLHRWWRRRRPHCSGMEHLLSFLTWCSARQQRRQRSCRKSLLFSQVAFYQPHTWRILPCAAWSLSLDPATSSAVEAAKLLDVSF